MKLLYSAMGDDHQFEFTERFVIFCCKTYPGINILPRKLTFRADSPHNRRIFLEIKKEMSVDGTVSLRTAHREFQSSCGCLHSVILSLRSCP